MTATTRFGLVLLALSTTTAGPGWWLVRRANAMPPPPEVVGRAVPGTVVDVLAAPCGTGNRRRTCYRPLVEYRDAAGGVAQVASRSAYGTASPYARGEAVEVIVAADGAAWLGPELAARQADARAEFGSRRRFPWLMGWLLVGAGGFGALLGLGMIFWVDHSVEPAG